MKAGTTYSYRVVAINSVGSSSYSNEISATTFSRPAAPSSLVGVSTVSGDGAKLTWKLNSNNETNIKIQRRDGSTGYWNVVKTLPAGTVQYQNNGLTPGVIYYYRIIAINSWGESDPSNEVIVAPGSTPFTANLIARSYKGNVQGAKVYVDRGDGFSTTPEPGETDASGTLSVNNIKIGNRFLVVKEKASSLPVAKGGHQDVDNLIYQMDLDNGVIDKDGNYSYDLIASQKSAFNVYLGHPIFNFNLVVLLNWDPTPGEIEDLKTTFTTASEYLFDVSDGQIKLGKVAIYSHYIDFWNGYFSSDMIIDLGSSIPKSGKDDMYGGLLSYPMIFSQYISFPGILFPTPPDLSYSVAIVHEFGHYALGFYDEYMNGVGNKDWRKNYSVWEFPESYGLMDNEYFDSKTLEFLSYSEMSSWNDYEKIYQDSKPEAWPEGTYKNVSAQLWEKKLPCWQWVKKKFEAYEPMITLLTPPTGYWDRQSGEIVGGQDRNGPSSSKSPEVFFPSFYKTDPIFIIKAVTDRSTSTRIQTQKLGKIIKNAQVFRKGYGTMQNIGLTDEKGEITIRDVAENIKLIAYKRDRWKFETSHPLLLSPGKRTSSNILDISSAAQDHTPGIIVECQLAKTSPQIMLNVVVRTDFSIDTVENIHYYFGEDSGSFNLQKVVNHEWIGQFSIDHPINTIIPKGYLDIALKDSVGPTISYVSEINFGALNDTITYQLQIKDMMIYVRKESISENQYVVFNSTYAVPIKSFGQKIVPVSEMYSFNLTQDNNLNPPAGVNIAYDINDAQGLNQNSIKIFRWDPTNSLWYPIEGSTIDIRRKIVSALVNQSGTFAVFATDSTSDIISPNKVVDLTANQGDSRGEIKLSWTAPGDDDSIGRASYYNVRLFDRPISEVNWDSTATLPIGISPASFGEQQEITCTFEDLNKTYFFAIRSVDKANNISQISNGASSVPSTYTLYAIPITIQGSKGFDALYIGKNENGTDSLNPGLDVPTTISGNQLNFYSEVGQNKLMVDFRSLYDSVLTWRLYLENASVLGDTLWISWDRTTIRNDGDYSMNGIDMKLNDKLMIVSDTVISILFKVDTTVTSVSGASELPKDFVLFQNYPNPWNPSTLINYNLPKRVNVNLEIFDILGRRVRSLVNDVQETGLHSVIWDGNNDAGLRVSSGTYFYRLTAKSIGVPNKAFTQVKKMLLLR